MAIGDTTKYSVWISTKDGNFINVCSDATLDYNLDYNGTTMGIMGQTTGNAIFVDKVGGAVGNITISGTRVNPKTSTDSSNENIVTNPSNADFMNKIKSMIEATQMFQNAYILRLYNVDFRNKENYDKYKDLYVFLKSVEFEIDWKNISEMNVTLECVRRNYGRGFGRS